jgi:hypothetical protein
MSPRPTIHRDFSIASAGFFNVLKPAAGSVKFRLPVPFRDPLGRTPKTPDQQAAFALEQTAEIASGDKELVSQLKILPPAEQGSHLLRLILIVLAATALTWTALWWIGHP